MNAESVRAPWTDALRAPMRTLNTVRHLHPVQVTNRAVRRLRPIRRLAAGEAHVRLVPRDPSRPADAASAAAFDGRSFCFLNRRLPWEGTDRWTPRGADALWIYNLHYFRYLWTVDASEAARLIADWIDANDDVRAVAWDPYPTSLRLREWIEWLLAHDDAPIALREAMLDSIAAQTDALRQRLEFHLMGNHLLENAITLAWAGLSCDGAAAAAWRRDGASLLHRELSRQVLADGTHDERSPMYQALLAESLLRLGEVAARSPHGEAFAIGRRASAAGERLAASLAHLTHPDGGYALLNDAALGIAPTYAALAARFAIDGKPGVRGDARLWSLAEGGYAGVRTADGTYLVFDGGPLGPDHQPGHGHADALSFELSHHGRRLVTDTGVFTYTIGAARAYDRSTAAHNTLEIDGRDQSELWGSFRCARRTSRHTLDVDVRRDHAALSAGYRGPGRDLHAVRHTRRILASARGLSFTDDVRAAGKRRGVVRLHFAPGTSLRPSHRGWQIEDGSRRVVGALVSRDLEWTCASSPYHPEFGREEERPSLTAAVGFVDRATVAWHLVLR